MIKNEHILGTAAEVLARRPDATLQSIAKAAGISRTTIFNKFATRDALIEALAVDALRRLGEVMARVRRAKTEAQTSQKTPVTRLVVSGPASILEAVKIGQVDLTEAGTIEVFEYLEADNLDCTVEL